MKLSILICTIGGRERLLNRLLKMLERQTSKQVEILIEKDNREMTIGAKRNLLLEQAKGEYVCYIDDDDMVSGDYIPRILKALETNPDCCGIEGDLIRKDATYRFIHSIQYNSWFRKGGIYYRCPNHLNPVKRELALLVGFHNKRSRDEDGVYSLQLRPLLKTEVFIKEPIYFYKKDYR